MKEMQRKERRHSGGKVQKEPSRDRFVAVMRREEEEGEEGGRGGRERLSMTYKRWRTNVRDTERGGGDKGMRGAEGIEESQKLLKSVAKVQTPPSPIGGVAGTQQSVQINSVLTPTAGRNHFII
ncbi:hypothetical protein CesoFtcFv8_008300 [Champsocephalus esox]|uniref:Uncharacterized protein n=1 Tax=Champsocephalus esox TaxID=159716 RepID=A0AAN8C857_9TELE|nr:hypothetical protein CesoFtcFv8_008300 [Champsocephalus esox]